MTTPIPGYNDPVQEPGWTNQHALIAPLNHDTDFSGHNQHSVTRDDLAVDVQTTLNRFDETHPTAVNVVLQSGAAQTIPSPLSIVHNRIVLSADCTFTFPTPGAGQVIRLMIEQDGNNGHYRVTWPVSVLFSGGKIPTLTATLHAKDYFQFICEDDISWCCFVEAYDLH